MPLSSRRVRSTSSAASSARLLTLLLLGSLAGIAQAERIAISADSPGKILQVTLEVDGGTPYYHVQRLGQPVLERSRLGFQLRNGRLDRGLVVLSQARQHHDDTWEQPWGETRLVRNHYNELSVSLGERSGAQRRFDVILRVYDDGIGLRYHFPNKRDYAKPSSTRKSPNSPSRSRPKRGGFLQASRSTTNTCISARR